jgi:hypothetical protein
LNQKEIEALLDKKYKYGFILLYLKCNSKINSSPVMNIVGREILMKLERQEEFQQPSMRKAKKLTLTCPNI